MITDDREDWKAIITDVCIDLAHDDEDNDNDVHVFDPMGDGPLFLLILLVFMVIVSLMLFI